LKLCLVTYFHLHPDFQVRRLGGAYGGKATPAQLVSLGAALAAHKVSIL
jgi:xanthine dehydrogenase molybdopterin-binding subunit B